MPRRRPVTGRRAGDRPQSPAVRRHLTLQTLDPRRLMAADAPLGATLEDTGEFLLGRVVVTPIFLDSNGVADTKTQQWDPGEIDEVLARITEGVNWWSDTLDDLNTVHSLEFIVDRTYADDPVSVDQEPIDRVSQDYILYANRFLDQIGTPGTATLEEGMFAFNHAKRVEHDADWAFSIFVADSSNDDGFFPTSGDFQGAFAFAGGLFFVMPSTRPASTVAHEMGHIFWALDEYAGGGTYAERRGYYDTQNLNAEDNPQPGFVQEVSIMADQDQIKAAYESNTTAAVTLAQVGWQDSDGNGIFDVLDVPLKLDGTGAYDSETETFQFRGEAYAQALRNQNPAGYRSDITLNRISHVQVSIDEGPWTTVSSPDEQVALIDITVSVPSNYQSFAIRVIDQTTGITSEELRAAAGEPILGTQTFATYAFVDENEDGQQQLGEAALVSQAVAIRDAQGELITSNGVLAEDLPTNTDLNLLDGITIRGNGLFLGDNIQVRTTTGDPLFHVYDRQFNTWLPFVGTSGTLQATFDSPTALVEVDVMSLIDGSYARVTAFDSNGNLIDRVTTSLLNEPDAVLDADEAQTLRLVDPQGRIARVEIGGHAQTGVSVSGIRYGQSSALVTDANGIVSFSGLADGVYQIDAVPESVIQSFGESPLVFQVAAGEIVGDPPRLAAQRVDSLYYNVDLPEDVNGDQEVSALDALRVINELNLNGARELTRSDSITSLVDVTNDGIVTALDALRVINYLNREGSASSEPTVTTGDRAVSGESTSQVVPVASDPERAIDHLAAAWGQEPFDADDDEEAGQLF
ncbi:MAG: dockerin type I domain-containing protein [Planctomycetota bacterium]